MKRNGMVFGLTDELINGTIIDRTIQRTVCLAGSF